MWQPACFRDLVRQRLLVLSKTKKTKNSNNNDNNDNNNNDDKTKRTTKRRRTKKQMKTVVATWKCRKKLLRHLTTPLGHYSHTFPLKPLSCCNKRTIGGDTTITKAKEPMSITPT